MKLKKKIMLSLTLATLVLSLGSVAWATEPQQQGRLLRRFITQGTVSAIEGTTLVLDTRQGERQVTTDEAIFWAPDVENPSLAYVQVGDQVVTFGRPDEDGSLAAKLVAIASAEELREHTVRGKVTAVEGQTLIITTREGEQEVITTSETYFQIPDVEEPGLDDVKVGCVITALGQKDDDGTFTAQVVTAARARPQKLIVQRNMVYGEVTAIEGTTLALDTPQGERQVTTDEAIFWAPDVENPSLADVQVGDQVIAFGRPDEDGSLAAKLVSIASVEELREHTVRGKVTAVEGQTLVITTREGEQEVITTSETYFQIPDAEEPGLDDVEVGCVITALGQKDDAFTAQVVTVARGRLRQIVQQNMVRGKVTAIEDTTLTVETLQGEKTILTDEDTRFHIPEVENPSIKDIEVGARIVALGRPNEDGDFVAKVMGYPKRQGFSPETQPPDLPEEMPSDGIIR